MNLSNAVGSGRPFRRAEWRELSDCGWYVSLRNLPTGAVEATRRDASGCSLTARDILAEDWEVRAEPKEFWLGLDERRVVRHMLPGSLPLTFLAEGFEWIRVKEVPYESI